MRQHSQTLTEADRCPFYCLEADTCRVSVAGLKIEWRRRKNQCITDDHDYCTLFISKVLRSSRPKTRLETWPLHQK